MPTVNTTVTQVSFEIKWKENTNLKEPSVFPVRKLHGLLIPDYRSLTHPLTLIRDSERIDRLL